jgi:6-pyruvoyltetrahydropterin/6-carboxytetrahydropterin synthase
MARAGRGAVRRWGLEGYRVVVDKQYLQFCSAHFITFKGAREPLHGHNYHCSVAIEGDLAPDGYVLDFGDVKAAARRACAALDHLVLLPGESRELQVDRQGAAVQVRYREERFLFPAADVAVLPLTNTTSEYLARYLAEQILRALPQGELAHLRAIEVGVEEAPGQRAWYRRDLGAPR